MYISMFRPVEGAPIADPFQEPESFSNRLYEWIRRESPTVAENCKPFLSLLRLDRSPEDGANRFAIEQHTQLITDLASLEGSQLQNLKNMADANLNQLEVDFCLKHFQMAEAYKLFCAATDAERSLTTSSSLKGRFIQSKFECYKNLKAWEAASGCIAEMDDHAWKTAKIHDLMTTLFRMRAFASASAVAESLPLENQYRENALRDLADVQKFEEVDQLLPYTTATVDYNAAAELSSQISPGLSAGLHMYSSTSLQQRSYDKIANHMARHQNWAQVSAIASSIVRPEIRSRFLENVAFNMLLQDRERTGQFSIEISLELRAAMMRCLLRAVSRDIMCRDGDQQLLQIVAHARLLAQGCAEDSPVGIALREILALTPPSVVQISEPENEPQGLCDRFLGCMDKAWRFGGWVIQQVKLLLGEMMRAICRA